MEWVYVPYEKDGENFVYAVYIPTNGTDREQFDYEKAILALGGCLRGTNKEN